MVQMIQKWQMSINKANDGVIAAILIKYRMILFGIWNLARSHISQIQVVIGSVSTTAFEKSLDSIHHI
ncbi:hypothetical protein BpHYR1_019258 [Brachionus plicatilis]|uniref:Uncharacterized protein n=1 Tax=Brachionus plicatilis TaxID=10195 RepID=A0A3M7PE87_BRAPC|nr:hypothetical protein BpHYR1_019258 [Brachionus plicatilis]